MPYSDVRLGLLTHALNYGTAVFGGPARVLERGRTGALRVPAARPLPALPRLGAAAAHGARDDAGGRCGWACASCCGSRGRATDCYVRALAFYGDETLGVRLHGLKPEVGIVALPFGHFVQNDENAHACISSWQRISDNVLPARGKIAGGYVNSALAKSDAQLAGFDEALVLNDDGHVCEGSVENLFVVARRRRRHAAR